MSDMRYMVSRARYAKDSIAVRCDSDDGFKTREARVVEAMNGRWSNREKAYIMADSKEQRLHQLIAAGWDGRLSFDNYPRTKMVLEPPSEHSSERAKE